jgi:dephospho-CoA kinase
MHNKKRPIIIAVTGGIASGKSLVVSEFKRLGAHVIDSDHISREVCAPGTAVEKKIVRLFGSDVVDDNGALNRRKLGAMVFADERKRRALERITHPVIVAEMRRRIGELKDAGVIVLEVPLLFEAGLGYLAGETVVVWVPKPVQIDRLRQRDKLRAGEIAQRLKAQWPLGEKRKLADYVIDNSGGRERTKKDVNKLWQVLTNNY